MNIYGLGESQWFLRYKDLKNVLGLGMSPGQPLSLGVQISNYLAKLFLSISEQSLEWLVRNSPDKSLVVLGTPVGQP